MQQYTPTAPEDHEPEGICFTRGGVCCPDQVVLLVKLTWLYCPGQVVLLAKPTWLYCPGRLYC